MELIVTWTLRGIFIALGLGAGAWIVDWFGKTWGTTPERWTVRLGAGMVLLAIVYTGAHVRLLAQRARIEAGREAYAVYGDPRRTEARRGEARGWILDCTGEDSQALAGYREQNGDIERSYPLGEGGANFIGGGTGAEDRDYTVEVLFSPALRKPTDLIELGELHPAGSDLQLTLCRGATEVAYRELAQTRRPGAVIVQDVATGALVGYAATGSPEDPPLGIKRYSPPGSVFKLALTALWWEHGMPDDIQIPCPAQIQVTPRASIGNYGGTGLGTVEGPVGMLIPSCNTAAVWMALRLRQEIGSDAFVEAYRRFGFEPYSDTPPTDSISDFWRTDSEAWQRRMSPAPSRIKISDETGPAEWAQLAIGQGPLDVTVIGVSRFIQAIANGGVMLRPAIEESQAERSTGGERIMSEETANRLQQAMRRVVVEGTGRGAETILQGTGWKMGGKTGTAQVPGRADNGWFAGILFSPDGLARYTIVSFVEGGGPGGSMPTTIAARVGRELIASRERARSGS